MEEPKIAHVVRIPSNGNLSRIVRLPLEIARANADSDNAARQYEDLLKHVPNLLAYRNWNGQAWKHRSLIDLGNADPDQTREQRWGRRGPYFMYKCSKEGIGLAPNENFERAQGATNDAPRIYGDVYIFKLKEPAFDASGVVRYDILDEDFTEYAFKGEGVDADESLKWLAAQ